MLDPALKPLDLIMSGDISFSYPYDKGSPEIVKYVDKFVQSVESYQQDWVL